jgi:hypothetical protein
MTLCIYSDEDKVAAVLNGKEAPLLLLATLIYNTFGEWL